MNENFWGKHNNTRIFKYSSTDKTNSHRPCMTFYDDSKEIVNSKHVKVESQNAKVQVYHRLKKMELLKFGVSDKNERKYHFVFARNAESYST
jgi:hypothetical protein